MPVALNDLGLAELAAEAASLAERLRPGQFVPLAEGGELIDSHWQAWASSLSRHDPEALPARLALSGWDASAIRPLLGRVRWRSAEVLPSWIQMFRRVLDEAASLQEDDFTLPFLQAARAALAETSGSRLGQLVPGAEAACEKSLVGRLSAISTDFLFETRSTARSCFASPDVFRAYPVAARLLSEITEYWVEAMAEFLDRLGEDFPEIREKFFAGRDPGRVAELSGFSSDSHNRGRSVLIARFEDGSRIVYKPRSLGLEAGYFDLLAWLNERHAPVELKAARALDRGEYGWMEWVGAEACASEEDLAAFYRRMGGLLALSHAFAGADLHFENLIACAGYPVAIDTEVWMAPVFDKPEVFAGEAALQQAFAKASGSVLGAAILPAWIPIGRDRVWNIGALETETGFFGLTASASGDHLPRWQGRSVTPRGYRADILSGFRDMYGFLLASRESLLADDGPVRAFRGQPVRFINRATELYGRALRRSFRPESLRSGLTRSFQLEAFLKPALHAGEKDRLTQLAIGSSEIRALERGDIPFFQGSVDSRGIVLPETGDTIAEFFTRGGLEVARHRLQSLSEMEREWQSRLVTVSFDLIAERPPEDDVDWPVDGLDFRAEADAIVEEIERSALFAGETPAWIAPKEIAERRFAIATLDASFYDGMLGVAVFLFAAERVTGNRRAGVIAREVFRLVARISDDPIAHTLRRSMFPGLMGLGGQIHALCLCHRLCGDGAMLDLARTLAESVTGDFIRTTVPAGLLRGTAGLLPALKSLHTATGESHWRDLASLAREQALASETTREQGIDGIVLDHLLDRMDEDSLAAVVAEAARPGLSGPDQLYSGNASRANFLITASAKFPDTKDAAVRLMRRAAARAKAHGGYVCYGNHPRSVTGPGFFQGLSGIGYTMLRLADPSLPDILLEEDSFGERGAIFSRPH